MIICGLRITGWHWPAFSDKQINWVHSAYIIDAKMSLLFHTHIHKHRRTGRGVSERHSSDRANVINEAHWARLAWDNHSRRVCHHAINSDDKPSLNQWKVKGPGLGAKDVNNFVLFFWVLTKELILKVGYSSMLSYILLELFAFLLKKHDHEQENMYAFDEINEIWQYPNNNQWHVCCN